MIMGKNECHVCPWRMAYLFDNPVRRMFHNPGKILGKYIKKNSVNVDVGCGMGYFSIGMAKLADSQSKIYSIDLQNEMLDVLQKRAKKAGVISKITPVKAESVSFRIPEKADFVLLFWVLHETADIKNSLKEIHDNLKSGGKLLIVEPGMHVSDEMIVEERTIAEDIGFRLVETPDIKLSKALVFTK